MEQSAGNCVQGENVAINTRRDPHVAPKYFLIRLNGIPDRVTKIGSGYLFRYVFVTLVSL